MRVIINADDLGMSDEVNEAIFTRMAQGCVTSASIMANGARLHAALQQLSHFPQCSFGVHLNADEFAPLSERQPLAPLLDDAGSFVPKRVRQVRTNRALLIALTREFSCQIEKLLSAGIKISHIDSHHHVHTIPWLFPALKQVQYRYGIRKVRLSMNMYPPTRTASRLVRWRKDLFNALLRRVYRTTTVSGFTNLATFSAVSALHDQSHDSVELMVHPGSQAETHEAALLDSIATAGLPWPGTLINYTQL